MGDQQFYESLNSRLSGTFHLIYTIHLVHKQVSKGSHTTSLGIILTPDSGYLGLLRYELVYQLQIALKRRQIDGLNPARVPL